MDTGFDPRGRRPDAGRLRRGEARNETRFVILATAYTLRRTLSLAR